MTVTPGLANATWGPVSLCLVLANTKVLSLSINVFSTKVIIEDTIFTSPSGDGTAILRGHQSHAKVAKGVPSFLSYFKTLSIGPALRIEPATSRSAVTPSTD